MGRKLVAFLAANAEDIALATGAVALSGGVAWASAPAFGLITAGVLLLAYGVWISPRSPKER